jgi:hypothetical protein
VEINLPENDYNVKGFDAMAFSALHRAPRPPRKNNEITRWWRYHDIYDYERPAKEEGFAAEAEEVTGAFTMSIAEGGQLVELKRKLGHKPDSLGKSKGDVIEGYSRESRNRFMKLLLSIDYGKMGVPLFYTLTYPGEFSLDPRVWKRDLHTFVMRMKREFPDLCGTWRLEPQKRGAPHFSGFLWGCDRLKLTDGKQWFSRQWFEVVGSGDEKHLRAGTGIDAVSDISEAIYYMAKYQTKADKGGVAQEFSYPVGRYWGIFERKRLAIRVEEFGIDKALYFKVRRVMRKLLESRFKEGRQKAAIKILALASRGEGSAALRLYQSEQSKKRFKEVIAGRQNGLWVKMTNQDIEKLLSLLVDER